MTRVVLVGVAVIGLLSGLSPAAIAQQPAAPQADIGKVEYQAGCAACHGADGKGAGPVAAALKTKPMDLTVLASKNNGVFPFGRVYDVIDGRQEVKAHGERDMPVWGFRYSPPPVSGSNPVASYFVDPLYDREPVVRARILAIIDYIYRLQAK